MSFLKKTLLDRLYDSLHRLPWWIFLGIGVIGYALLEWLQRAATPEDSALLAVVALASYAPIWLSFFVCLTMLALILRLQRAKLVDSVTGLADLRALPWKDFEALVAEVCSREGYGVSYSSLPGPDGGVDVELRRDGKLILIQCKQWRRNSVGVSVVREMFGLLHDRQATEAWIVTTGDFTPEALAFAKGKPIRLLDGPDLWAFVREVRKEHLAVSGQLTSQADATQESTARAEQEPRCPECGGEMVRRQAKGGSRPGAWFWGCRRFPDCKGSRSI